MKVAIINTMCRDSSTGKIAYSLFRYLLDDKKADNDAFLFYGIGNQEGLENQEHIVKFAPSWETKLHFRYTLLTGVNCEFGLVGTNNLIKLLKEIQPDIIQLYNLHGSYLHVTRIFDYLGSIDIPVVYSMLDEYPYMGYCCYPFDCEQFKTGCQHCRKSFRNVYPRSLVFNRARESVLRKQRNYAKINKIIFTGPQYVINRAKESYLLHDADLRVVDEFIDNRNIFFPEAHDQLCRELNLPIGKILLLNVAPSSDSRKGVQYFVELARKLEKDDRFLLINVGYQGNFDGRLPSNFITVSVVKDQRKLAKYYSVADLFICTSMADTMPNTCLEALSCGTPVLGFDISGIPFVADEPLGHFVEAANVKQLKEFITGQATERKTQETVMRCREYALRRYSPDTYYSKMKSIYSSVLSE